MGVCTGKGEEPVQKGKGKGRRDGKGEGKRRDSQDPINI